MKRITAIFMVMAVMILGMTACGDKKDQPKATSAPEQPAAVDKTSDNKTAASGSGLSEELKQVIDSGKTLTGKHHVKIKVKKYGTITAELYADKAPVTVTNFIKLAGEGFYDGLTFHRIISSFMIQGGDPNADGTGGAEENIKGEFSANGVKNDLSHVRGTLSMARSQLPDSASSQFFIMHQDSKQLDGQYAAFGKVTKGIKVVDKICFDAKPIDDNGTINKEDQPVIESIKVID